MGPAALLLAFAIAGGVFLWRHLDDVLDNIDRPAKIRAVAAEARCFRCNGELAGDRCCRCKTSNNCCSFEVREKQVRHAVAPGLLPGQFIEHQLTLTRGRQLSLVTRSNVVVRNGDHIRLTCDRRWRLRRLENLTVGSGWQMPLRALGQRSPLAFVGALPFVCGLALALFVLPVYLFVSQVDSALSATGNHDADINHMANQLALLAVYAVALIVFAALLALARSRPRLNRDVGEQLRSLTASVSPTLPEQPIRDDDSRIS